MSKERVRLAWKRGLAQRLRPRLGGTQLGSRSFVGVLNDSVSPMGRFVFLSGRCW